MEKALSSLRYLQTMMVVTTKESEYVIYKCQNGEYEVNEARDNGRFETSEQVMKCIGKPDKIRIIYTDPNKEEITWV
jgi:hypothetical protein